MTFPVLKRTNSESFINAQRNFLLIIGEASLNNCLWFKNNVPEVTEMINSREECVQLLVLEVFNGAGDQIQDLGKCSVTELNSQPSILFF